MQCFACRRSILHSQRKQFESVFVRFFAADLSDSDRKILRQAKNLKKKAAKAAKSEASKDSIVSWNPNIKKDLDSVPNGDAVKTLRQLNGEIRQTFKKQAEPFRPAIGELGWQKLWTPKETKLEEFQNSDVFSMVLPPPNLTGDLHMGHALDVAKQDAVARFQRLNGKKVLWIPGCDHAGIGTQVTAERNLSNTKKLDRHALGRKQFVEYIDKLTRGSSLNIESQLRRLGASLNWNFYTYTLSKQYSEAVTEAFCLLFDRGLIKRSKHVRRWSPSLQSVISDSEVEMREIKAGKNTFQELGSVIESKLFGLLYYIDFDIHDSNEKITVATTRPETLFADIALAVNPGDQRYSSFIGLSAVNPLNNSKLPIVADRRVVMSTGSGVMKLTPGHNSVDYEIWKCNESLSHRECLSMYDSKCRLNGLCGQFQGLNRFEAREKAVDALSKMNKLMKSHERASFLPFCARSGDLLEFMPVDQWVVDSRELAKKWRPVWDQVEAIDSSGVLREEALDVYEEAGRTNGEWCISRQIWWGHQVPAYRVFVNGQKQGFVSERSEELALQEAAATYNCHPDDVTLEQDEDVLDTWFSSALYPLASLGWPSKTPEQLMSLGVYPLSLLVTGKDITKSWVSRMLMLCTELSEGVVPFKAVYLHGLVLDPIGRKMSKSLGNVVDPLDVVNGISARTFSENMQKRLAEGKMDSFEGEYFNKVVSKLFGSNGDASIPACGADSLRMMLLARSSHDAKNFKLHLETIMQSLEFCNKLKNVASFLIKRSEVKGPLLPTFDHMDDFLPPTVTVMDKYILSNLCSLQSEVTHLYSSLNFAPLVVKLNVFLRQKFSSVYLEYVGQALNDPETRRSAYCTAVFVLAQFVKLCHPVIPFFTEKVFQQLRFAACSSLSPEQFRFHSLLDHSFFPLDRIKRLDNQEINAELLTDAFVEDALRSLQDLAGQVVDSVKGEIAGKTTGDYSQLQVVAPNYPLLTKSMQLYFKRLVEMKLKNVEVLLVDNSFYESSLQQQTSNSKKNKENQFLRINHADMELLCKLV